MYALLTAGIWRMWVELIPGSLFMHFEKPGTVNAVSLWYLLHSLN